MDGNRRIRGILDCFPDDNDDFGPGCLRPMFDKGWISRPGPTKWSRPYRPYDY